MRRYNEITIIFFTFFLTFCSAQTNNDSAKQGGCKTYIDSYINKSVYLELKEPPSYKGGQAKLLKYVSDNLRIKKEDYNFSKVFLYVIIGEDNSPLCIVFKKRLPIEVEAKIKEILMNNKNWITGKCNGKKVVSKYEFVFGWCLIVQATLTTLVTIIVK